MHKLLDGAIALTQDVDIGLKAAREIRLGDYGAVEYAARSAPTWGDASKVVGRFLRLLNGALTVAVYEEGDFAAIQLNSTVTLPRAAADFQSGAFHISGKRVWPPGFRPTFEVWFTHAEPPNTDEYHATFDGGSLHFNKPWNGFVILREYFAIALPSADPQLHALVRKQAEAMLSELPRAQSLTERVREHVANDLSSGDSPTITRISRKLAMSKRTLARKLREEGTTFSDLYEDIRRRMALRFVRQTSISFSEITFLLAFSQPAAFYRAFRRWTGQTPRDYRLTPKTLLDAPR